jgi:hypothetical protein
MDANDSVFYTSLYTFLGGFILALAGLVYKCKSKKIKLCGCLEIQRDVQVELKEDLATLNRSQSIDNNPIRV